MIASYTCSPCAWVHKPVGCSKGDACRYCHGCPPGEIKRRKKEKIFYGTVHTTSPALLLQVKNGFLELGVPLSDAFPRRLATWPPVHRLSEVYVYPMMLGDSRKVISSACGRISLQAVTL